MNSAPYPGDWRKAAALMAAAIDRLSDTAGILAGMLALSCAGIVAYGAFARYVLNHPTVWEMRLTPYLLIVFVFLSIGFGLKQGAHVRVDVFFNLVSQKTQTVFQIIGLIGVLGFSLVFGYYSWKLLAVSFRISEVDPVLPELPVWPTKALMLAGVALLGLQALRMLAADVHLLCSNTLKPPEKAWDRPVILTALFLVLTAIGLWVLKSNTALGVIILLCIMLSAGMPVAFSLALMGILGYWAMIGHKVLITVPNVGYASLNTFVLLALPLFVLAGQIIQRGGLAERIFRAASAWIGHIPGGLGVATVLSCAVFAAISGSSVANAAAMGMIAIPHLTRLGYDRRLSYGLVAVGGTLGILIPPSSGMILFGVITEQSVGKLFAAGIMPGCLMMVLLMITVLIVHRRKIKHEPSYQEGVKSSWQDRWSSTRKAWAGLLLPVFILGGMYSGAFTASEAAGVAVAYALLVTLFTVRITWSEWLQLIRDSTLNITMIMMIFVGAMILGSYLTVAQIPQKITMSIVDSHMSNGLFIFTVMVLLLVLGMFMEAGAVAIVILPVLYPVMVSLNINFIWFAIVMIINAEIACISPPVGLNLYVIQRVSNADFRDVVLGVLWFVPAMFVTLIIALLWPQLSLWLPGTMN